MFDVVVIGAGVVGLAVARRFVNAGHEVLILERNPKYGLETSSRNSEVIHAGIYYPKGSLKSDLCIAGNDLIYKFCEDRSIPFVKCGKLIVATSAAQEEALTELYRHANSCNAKGLTLLSSYEASKLEPEVMCHQAIFSSQTGIIDSSLFMQSLLGEATSKGAELVCHTEVNRISPANGGWDIYITGEKTPVLRTRFIINCAGHGAPALAAMIEGLPESAIPRSYYAKGNYFVYSASVPFRHLIYPLPEPGGLGTHLTLDIGMQGRFGPDVEWCDRVDYNVSKDRKPAFLKSIRTFWPNVNEDFLHPGYVGVRPKIAGPDELPADFKVSSGLDHGLPGLVNMFGIESPGLTASLALAELIFDKFKEESA